MRRCTKYNQTSFTPRRVPSYTIYSITSSFLQMDTSWGRHAADEEKSSDQRPSGPSSVPPHHVVRNGDVGRDISVRCQRCVGEKPRWRARGDLIVFPRILSPPHLAHLPNLNRLPVAVGGGGG